MTLRPDPEVLVVGAGPTGLVAATQLAARGVSVRIIDAAPVRSDKSRALGVQARTLELLDKMGLAEPLIDQGRRSVGVNVHARGRAVAHLGLGDLDMDHTPFPFLLFVSQVQTERVLEEHLTTLGVEVERPVELLDLRQDEQGVTARVRRDGVDETIGARYLVGADGAHSAVRHALELPFRGEAYRSEFMLGDVEATGDLDFEELHIFVSRGGVIILFPMAQGMIRVMATGFRPEPGAGEPTLDELQQQVQRLTQRPDFRLQRATWLSRFRLHHRGVDQYRVGQVFLAGDAAHIHSPAGGQGMNTGIQDAYNLAWKLAMVLRGEAAPELLDSYHAERHPVGQRLLEFTDRLFTVISSLNPVVTWLRTLLVPLVAPRLLSARGSRVMAFTSQTGIRYRHSPAVEEHLEGADARFRGGPRAGDRAPGAPLPGGRLLTRMRGTGWWLLAFTGIGEASVDDAALRDRLASARAEAPWIQTIVVSPTARDEDGSIADPEGALHQRYGLAGPGLVLVRPDGHIAFRSFGADAEPLQRWLARQRPQGRTATPRPDATGTRPHRVH